MYFIRNALRIRSACFRMFKGIQEEAITAGIGEEARDFRRGGFWANAPAEDVFLAEVGSGLGLRINWGRAVFLVPV